MLHDLWRESAASGHACQQRPVNLFGKPITQVFEEPPALIIGLAIVPYALQPLACLCPSIGMQHDKGEGRPGNCCFIELPASIQERNRHVAAKLWCQK